VIQVAIPPWEGEIITAIGQRRTTSARAAGLRHKWGATEQPDDVGAAFAEATFAKWINRWWLGGPVGPARYDVGDVQVRWTKHTGGHLLLHPEDHPEDRCVLVVGEPPKMMIAGYVRRIGDFQKPEFFRTVVPGRPCYWIPQAKLLRPSTFMLDIS
jgi:hypothetical protein